jgi:hypothetical protein
MRLVTFTVFALIALLGAPAVAQAQPQLDVGIGGIGFTGGTPRAITVGWIFVHPTNCMIESTGTTTTFYVLTGNPDGLYFFTSHPGAQNILSPACQSGNRLGFHITNLSGAWDQIFTTTSR